MSDKLKKDETSAPQEAAAKADGTAGGRTRLVLHLDPEEIDFLLDAGEWIGTGHIGGIMDTGGMEHAVRKLIRDARARYLVNHVISPRSRGPSTAGYSRTDEEIAEIQARHRQREEPVEPVQYMPVASQRVYMRGYLKSGKWDAGWGPAPGEKGSIVTAEALRDFGLEHLHDRGKIEIELPEREEDDLNDLLYSPGTGATNFWR